MEYGKKDWQRSEGRYRSLGREEQDKEKRLSAYHPAESERTKEKKPNEMMTMESSYGGIAFGANRKQKMTMVVHEKRSSHGSGLKNDNRQVEGSRKTPISSLRGTFYTNSHDSEDSAFAYEEDLQETQQKMIERLREMMDENHQRSGEQVLPFLNRKEDREKQKEIAEQLREHREKGNRKESILWEKRQETFKQEQAQKERMYRQFYKELAFAREKSKKLMKEDVVLPSVFLEEVLQAQEDGSQEEPEEGGEEVL